MRIRLLQLTVMASVFVPSNLFAASTDQCNGLNAVTGGTTGHADDSCNKTDLLNSINNNIIDTLFIVAGAIAVIILILGGIRYITSTGDSARIKAAKDTILYAIVGLIVVIVARAIVGFVAGTFK